MWKWKLCASLAVCFFFIAGTVEAEIKLPSIFGDHMVLQGGAPLPFWGQGEPGQKIRVSIRGDEGKVLASKEAVVDASGQWRLELPSLQQGAACEVHIVCADGSEVLFGDVLIGEVWLCSGQSNMAWDVSQSENGEAAVAAANHPEIRLFQVSRAVKDAPQVDLEGSWEICRPEAVADFSAVAYYFGRELRREQDVPVGLIGSYWGGTPAQAWTPREPQAGDPATRTQIDKYKAYTALSAETRKNPEAYGKFGQKGPGCLYNGMIHPLIPYAIRGAIWYQGESNASDPRGYKTLFPMMIQAWREHWGQGEFPFLYVELANYQKAQVDPVEEGWASIREAQGSALSLPAAYAVTAIDIGAADTVHPLDKESVGRRLALAALGRVYGRDGLCLSPRYAGHVVEGQKIRISFSDAEGGLHTDDGQAPHPFAIQGSDGAWHWADAAIDGETILVWNDEVPHPSAVRYAWATNPDVNVYSQAGLPLMPFRTDPDD